MALYAIIGFHVCCLFPFTVLVDTDGWMVKKFNQMKDFFNRKKESHLPMEEPRGKPGDSKSATNAKHDPDDKLPKGHPPIKGKGSEYEEVFYLVFWFCLMFV